MLEEYGYTIPILVYCSDVKRAVKNIGDQSVLLQYPYKITGRPEDTIRYARFDT